MLVWLWTAVSPWDGQPSRDYVQQFDAAGKELARFELGALTGDLPENGVYSVVTDPGLRADDQQLPAARRGMAKDLYRHPAVRQLDQRTPAVPLRVQTAREWASRVMRSAASPLWRTDSCWP